MERRAAVDDFSHHAAVLGTIWSRVEEVLPFLVTNDESYNLPAGRRATPFLTSDLGGVLSNKNAHRGVRPVK